MDILSNSTKTRRKYWKIINLNHKVFAFVIIFIGYISMMNGQGNVQFPILTKKQMFSEFDSLTNIISNYNPQLHIHQLITKVNILNEIKELRKNIDTINSYISYLNLIKLALKKCNDGHCNFIIGEGINYYISSGKFRNHCISNYDATFWSLIDDSINNNKNWIEKQNKLNIKTKYLNGIYYNLLDFEYNNKIIKAGWQIQKIDNIPTVDYVNNLSRTNSGFNYDFDKNCFYRDDFIKYIKNIDSIKICFLTNDNDILNCILNLKKSVKILNANPINAYLTKYSFLGAYAYPNIAVYYDSAFLLYIHLDEMEFGEDYNGILKTITTLKNNKKIIKNFIIDCRNNNGGNDAVWIDLFSKIISDTIRVSIKHAMNFKFVDEYKSYFDGKIDVNEETFPLLDNVKYFTHTHNIEIVPDSNSLFFKGKICLLVDELIYSSTGAFLAVANIDTNILSIGNTPGKILGLCPTPVPFILPYSKIIFRMQPIIDLTNVRKVNDCFQNNVEVPIIFNINEYLKYYNYGANIIEYDSVDWNYFRFNIDPYFQKALQVHDSISQ